MRTARELSPLSYGGPSGLILDILEACQIILQKYREEGDGTKIVKSLPQHGGVVFTVPARLAANCGRTPESTAWLKRLPSTLRELERRWSISLGATFNCEDVSCAWVARVRRADGTPAVLKLGMPHMESEHELQGLRFWDGDPTVQLLEADDDLGAMLLERCEPGAVLRSLPEPEQDLVIARLLNRLWRSPSPPHPFRPLAIMIAYWSDETLRLAERWHDPGLVNEGLRLFEELPRTASREVLLATDLHAGNVLRAQREPWLVIDPKPFVGDPAYDATQHLFNCTERLRADPEATIRRFADLLSVDHERVGLWTFARAAAEPRDAWEEDGLVELARAIAP
jgi:streptomycin 6-kinase